MARKDASVATKKRINVQFKPATGGAVEEIELPMKVMVLGDFLQRHDPRALMDRKPVSVNKNNFAEVMANQKLSVDINVANVLEDGKSENSIPVSLNIESMRDFEPGKVLEQVPATNKLLRIREALTALKGPMGNMPAFRKALEAVLSDPRQRLAVEKELEQAGIHFDLTSARKDGAKDDTGVTDKDTD